MAELGLSSVWGATATRLDNGDYLFEALEWNDEIGVGGQAAFGFVAYHGGTGPLHLDGAQFMLV